MTTSPGNYARRMIVIQLTTSTDPIPAEELEDTAEFPTLSILDDETRGPTEEDWAEYRAHFARLDRVEALYGYE